MGCLAGPGMVIASHDLDCLLKDVSASLPLLRLCVRIMLHAPSLPICTDPDGAIGNKVYRYGVLICFSLGNTSSC